MRVIDLTTDLSHKAKNTSGSILARVALKDRSKAIVKGMIRIQKDARQSNSYLAQHAILLSPSASGITIPGLEILTNDVRATHSASVAQLDEEQIFYIRTRGVDKESAIKMVTLGFFEHALARLSQPYVREGLRVMLEDKWDGRAATFRPIEAKEAKIQEEGRDLFEGHYKYR